MKKKTSKTIDELQAEIRELHKNDTPAQRVEAESRSRLMNTGKIPKSHRSVEQSKRDRRWI